MHASTRCPMASECAHAHVRHRLRALYSDSALQCAGVYCSGIVRQAYVMYHAGQLASCALSCAISMSYVMSAMCHAPYSMYMCSHLALCVMQHVLASHVVRHRSTEKQGNRLTDFMYVPAHTRVSTCPLRFAHPCHMALVLVRDVNSMCSCTMLYSHL